MGRFYQYNKSVTADLDLNLFPLYRIQGQEMPQIPGLLAMTPPKRVARGRDQDALLVYLTLSGNIRFSFAEYNQIMDQATRRFYQVQGSLTSAIRAAAGDLNQSLLNRNLRTSVKGEYVVGRLILGALRGTQFVFAQCGPTHVFHLAGAETKQIHDDQIAGRGLGIAQTTPLYFGQVDLHPDDLLVLSPNLPAGWDPVFSKERHVSPEAFRRRLFGSTSDDLNAVLVQAQSGKGVLNLQKGTSSAGVKPVLAVPAAPQDAAGSDALAVPAREPAGIPVMDPVIPTSQVDSAGPASRFSSIISGDGTAGASNDVPLPQEPSLPDAGDGIAQPVQPAAGGPIQPDPAAPEPPASNPARRTGRFVAPRTSVDIPEIKRTPSPRRREFFAGLARFVQGLQGGAQKVSQGVQKFSPKLLPASRDDSEVASSSLALLAVVVPVIIVAIAATVYIHYGRTAQFQQYYEMALEQANQASGQTSVIEVRRAWESTIYYIEKAEKIQKTQDSAILRQQAQTALDNLDGILRLDFRQAIIGGLSRSVQISRMAATDTDLYLLDSSRGAVMRTSMTNQGYQVDAAFKCDPGQYDTIIVESLVDLVALPMSNAYDARVLAIDRKGNLLYCGPSGASAASLAQPQLGWKNIAAFTLDSDGKYLYVLDPASSAIWQYAGTSGQFTDLPIMFFGEQVPQNMNMTVDLAANNADLYMLFQDGHVAACPLTRYDVAPMRCTDPITYVDARPDRQPGPKINDAIFTQLAFASAPDPSLYMLEPLTRAIYRFSPRPDSLELRGQFRATIEQNNSLFDGPAAAMVISPNRYAFFSVGNQVYLATDVP
jgi:hypothetical protein